MAGHKPEAVQKFFNLCRALLMNSAPYCMAALRADRRSCMAAPLPLPFAPCSDSRSLCNSVSVCGCYRSFSTQSETCSAQNPDVQSLGGDTIRASSQHQIIPRVTVELQVTCRSSERCRTSALAMQAVTLSSADPRKALVILVRLVCQAARPVYVTHAAWQTQMIRCQMAYRQVCARSGRRRRSRACCGAVREDCLQALHHLRLESLGVSLQRR